MIPLRSTLLGIGRCASYNKCPEKKTHSPGNLIRPHNLSPQGLRASLASDGYLYVKGLFPSSAVEAAGAKVMDHLASLGTVLDPAFPRESGVLRERCGLGCIPFMEGKNDITQSPEVAGVIAGTTLSKFMEQLLVRMAHTCSIAGMLCVVFLFCKDVFIPAC